MAFVIFWIAFLAVLGVASIMGWTHDSRDPDYAMRMPVRPHSH